MSMNADGGFAGSVPAEPSAESDLPKGWVAHHAPEQVSAGRRFWLGWRRWRRSRPVWGGLFSILGGGEILLTERTPLPVVVHLGPTGLAGIGLPVLMVLCGILLWLAPGPRVLYAMLVLLASLGTWITSNLGGFFVGMLQGLVGGALALTWTTAPRGSKKKNVTEESTEDSYDTVDQSTVH